MYNVFVRSHSTTGNNNNKITLVNNYTTFYTEQLRVPECHFCKHAADSISF